MREFLDKLSDGIRKCQLANQRVLVAVSGGADSVALLRGLVEIAPQFSMELCVGHLNHRVRGQTSDDDASWVESLARSLQLPSEIGRVSDDAFRDTGGSFEEAARELRYEFLESVASKRNRTAIALAHTADDQAETVLHHLLRGTGLMGMRGMMPVRTSPSGISVVRPMLGVRRAMLENYLRERGQPYRTDHTNDDVAITRNKLRHVVLPLLRETINPQVDAAISRLAEQAVEVEELMRRLASQLLNSCLLDAQTDTCRLDVSSLADQPTHLVRELFRELWLRQSWPQQAMSFEHWNRLAEIVLTHQTIILPNRIEVRFHTDRLMVVRKR